eukprot:488761-Amphidinium_carterae.1
MFVRVVFCVIAPKPSHSRCIDVICSVCILGMAIASRWREERVEHELDKYHPFFAVHYTIAYLLLMANAMVHIRPGSETPSRFAQTPQN